jgi:endonuclease/exonuclease/phosphatase family metal-dependent hydrolase
VTAVANLPSFTALTYNARLWGNTGLVNGQLTRLYLDDHRRVDQIAERLLGTNPDLIGLQEVFCPEMQDRLIARLKPRYPYYARTITYDGVEQSIRTVRRLWPRYGDLYARNIQKVVDYFTLSHYSRDGWIGRLFRKVVSEDAALRFLFEATENQFLWGAGLLFFSKFPILESAYVPHPARADLEWFADKGVLKTTVETPEPVTVLVTHLQEGETPQALAARRSQLDGVQDLMKGPERAILLGDLNIPEGSSVAGGLDCYRACHPDPQGAPGSTYRAGNSFERKLLGESHPFVGGDLRLDYLFARGLQVLGSGVLEAEFNGLSDHSPVFARFG